jgi:hypothetical protein
MQITGSNSFSNMRKPSSMGGGQEGQRLVFLYPMIFDMNLMSYQNDIRDLLTVDFIGQIKTSNVLNIVSDSTAIGVIGKGPNQINPAEQVRKNLDYYSYQNNMSSNINYPQIDTNMTYTYQNKIDSFLNFIQNQIQYDPRYKKFRPLISSLTLTENLINIPLIVGTKLFQMESEILYWVLLIGIVFNIPLNTESNIRKIINIYNSIRPETIMQVIYDDELIEKLVGKDNVGGVLNIAGIEQPKYKQNIFGKPKLNKLIVRTSEQSYKHNLKNPNIALSNLKRYIGDRINMQITINFSKCVNRRLWDIETDHMSTTGTDISAKAVGTISSSTQRYHFQKAFGSFKSYITNTIVPILYGLEELYGPFPINSNVTMHTLIEDIFNHNIFDRMTGTYISLANNITNFIQGIVAAESDISIGGTLKASDFKKINDHIKDIYGVCQLNVSLTSDITDLINKFNSASILPVNYTGSTLSNFLNNMMMTAGKLNSHSHTINDWFLNILRDYPDINSDGTVTNSNRNVDTVFENTVKRIKEEFRNSINGFLNSLFPEELRSNSNPSDFINRYKNFSTIICDLSLDRSNPGDGIVCRKRLVQITKEISDAMTDILYFFFLWNFLSYMCSYMEDIEIDIKIQERDVLDFPNYCLVLPIEIVSYLYNIVNIKNLRKLLTNSETAKLGPREGFIADTNDVGKMIDVITLRLKIPNIIVINRKRKEILYKFMYMNRFNKGTLDSIKTYISHQSQVLPGF